MKKILFTFLFTIITCSTIYSQRVLINENFENAGFNADSLPTHWLEVHQTQPTNPVNIWAVRDSGTTFPGVNTSLRSQSYQGHRSISIPWTAGNPIADDWVITDSLRIQTGDSLIFWMLLGQPVGINFGGLIDTMQVHVCFVQDPAGDLQKLATIRSLDSNNVWTVHKYSLSPFAGQLIYVAFRYFMNTSVDGLRVNIDNVFVGNHSAIGITPISTNVPKEYALKQNYPNPFNPTTNINFDLPHPGFVNLIVYDMLGQQVATLVNQDLKAGSFKVDWNAQDLPSGTYFYRITVRQDAGSSTGSYFKTNKMILIK